MVKVLIHFDNITHAVKFSNKQPLRSTEALIYASSCFTTPQTWKCFGLSSSVCYFSTWGFCGRWYPLRIGVRGQGNFLIDNFRMNQPVWACPFSSKLGLQLLPYSGRRPELPWSSLSWTGKPTNLSKNHGSSLDTQHQKLLWAVKEKKVHLRAVTGFVPSKWPLGRDT